MKILIIDKQKKYRDSLKEVLLRKSSTMDIQWSSALEESKNLITQGRYDCIISEYIYDDGNAFDLIQFLNSLEYFIPLIIITGHGGEIEAVKLIRAGAQDYFPKKYLHENNTGSIIYDSIIRAINLSSQKIEQKRTHRALAISEERYRGLIENSPALILRFFKDDNIINFVNDGFCRYFGMERYDIIGEDISLVIPEPSIGKILNDIAELDRERSITNFEMRTELNGRNLWQQWTVQAIFDRGERLVEYQCIGEDITPLKESNEKLQDALKVLREIKHKQDGDYFLTSVVLEPLGRNLAQSDRIQIEFFVKEYKSFTYRNWNRSIGGDICFSHNIFLRGKTYMVFLNADAMGKSMQGASGALVLGAIIHGIIDRTRFSVEVQDEFPEVWLRNAFMEMHRVFESFDGAMLMSLVMGLAEEDSGLVYYVNAEHPWNVLYRNGSAQFVETELTLRKLGLKGFRDAVRILTFQLEHGDVIIAGSDGRDELILKDENNREYVNADERLFLAVVEKGDGNLERIYQLLTDQGEIRDDLSLLKLTYLDLTACEEEKRKMSSIMQTYQKMRNSAGEDEAVQFLEQSLSSTEKHVPILHELIQYYFAKQEYDLAYKYADEYINMAPYDADCIYMGSWASGPYPPC